MVERTMASSPLSWIISLTKERSIFSSWNGRCFSRLSEENPVP